MPSLIILSQILWCIMFAGIQSGSSKIMTITTTTHKEILPFPFSENFIVAETKQTIFCELHCCTWLKNYTHGYPKPKSNPQIQPTASKLLLTSSQ